MVEDPQRLALSEMELAERLIFEACYSQVPAVSLGAAHIMRAGGKRIRPLVLILAARACGFEGMERPARVGAAVELIHTATLVHDDVVDEADTRRGQYSVNIFLGNEASVLMGDYLVCRALRMIADEPDVELMRAICDVIVSMCEAEVLQIAYRGEFDNSFENYFRVIRNKTARLFWFTSLAGARIAGVSPEQIEHFGAFGMNLGIAFQIVDDILDLLGKVQELGKPTGSDLREGKFTYAVLHALRNTEGATRQSLVDLLARRNALTGDEIRDAVEMVSEAGGIAAAQEQAKEYGRLALEALCQTPPGPERDGLEAVVAMVLDRRV